MADRNQLIPELRAASQAASDAADKVESAAGYLDYAADEGAWSREDRERTEAALDEAISDLQGPKWPSDLIKEITELKSEARAVSTEIEEA